MQKEEGKDYFGFQGQAALYQKYRPQYPSEFIKLMIDDTYGKDFKKGTVVDIATGTGFLAKHFSSSFERVVGTDISEAQLKQASEAHQAIKNIEFKQLDVKELPKFLESNDLVDKVDLFSIGQGLHWLEVENTLKVINSVLTPNSYFSVFAYTKPLIYDGSNWEERVAAEKMAEKGYEVINGKPEDYKFDKDREVHKKISDAYEEFWTKVYSHFRFDRSVIEKFYQPFNFEEHIKILRKTIWYDITPNKPISQVIGYFESVSAYQCYLEDYKIEKGSDEDPLVIFKKQVAEFGDAQIDFVTPYFAFSLGKKE